MNNIAEMAPRRGGTLAWLLRLVLLHGLLIGTSWCVTHKYQFKVKESKYTRLCTTKSILTVNGEFPGPTIYASRGDTVTVEVSNRAKENITLHWHGVKQPRNPWSDGPEYITQCPIQPGQRFTYTVVLSNEEGTVWWHAHSTWTRATAHGAIVVYPNATMTHPFPKFRKEFLLVLGEWWNKDMKEVYQVAKAGITVPVADAWTINGQPGDLYPCSKPRTYKMQVEQNKTYMLRMVNAGLSSAVFVAVARHRLTVVGSDGCYLKPFATKHILIAPGETIDALLHADQRPSRRYYVAARSFSYQDSDDFNGNTTTAILEYAKTSPHLYSSPLLPHLPYYNDTNTAVRFAQKLRSLADTDHPISVPSNVDRRIYTTVAINRRGKVLKASLSNNSFVFPAVDVLEAYYRRMRGVFLSDFPDRPPQYYNFTADTDSQPKRLLVPGTGTRVKVLEFGENVELVFQGTSLVLAEDHPLHLHGYSFYVMGIGFGNFDPIKDPLGYNYVDPPKKNTMEIPRAGWAAVRFKATNPGVWYMHCHLERHLTWGMSTAFIVKDGACPSEKMLPRPSDMPPC